MPKICITTAERIRPGPKQKKSERPGSSFPTIRSPRKNFDPAFAYLYGAAVSGPALVFEAKTLTVPADVPTGSAPTGNK